MAGPARLFLIDGHSYIFRAFYAVPHLSNPQGFPTNAIFGFINMLLKVIREQKPDYCAVVFDPHGPTFRDEIYPQYKANRREAPEELKQQIPRIKEVVAAFNIPTLEAAGFEADDVIGTLARRAESAGLRCVIVTGDKDLMQLVSPTVTLLDTMRDLVVDEAGVREKFGVPPAQVADVLGLAGDSSDNVKGVPGIGDKGATALIQEFGSVENLLARVVDVKLKRARSALEASPEAARLGKTLCTIRTDVPIEAPLESLAPRPPDEPRLRALLTEFNFGSLLKAFAPEKTVSYEKYRLVLTPEELGDLAKRLRASREFSFDLETTGIDPMRVEIVGLSFSCAAHEAFYVPVAHHYLGVPGQLPLESVLAAIRPAWEEASIAKFAQNAKYDTTILARHGIVVAPIRCDPMVASYLLHPEQRQHNLESIARDILGHQMITYAEVTGTGKKQIGFAEVDVETAKTYSGEDADVTLLVAHELERRLEESGLMPLFRDLEMPLLPVLREMEMTGVRLDVALLGALSKEMESSCDALRAKIAREAGGDFNPDSPKQLQEVLFERLKLPRGRKTKTGYSTDVDVLETLARVHPLPAAILEYRSLIKLKNTYVDSLPPLVNPKTGRLHTSYNQTVAATGRLSSSDPNLQNIPIRTPEGRRIRSAFIPTEGWTFLSADYSQIELRVLAHLSKDPVLIEAFRSGEDIHTRTAAELFGVMPGLVDEEMRRRAKTINFGVIYGMSAHGLAGQLGIPHGEAQKFIDAYFERYSGVRRFFDRLLEEARRTKRVSTLLGRIRRVPEIEHPTPNLRGMAERIALNTPIQGTAADLIKRAMLRAHAALHASGLRSRMILQVHDELVFECPPAELPRLRPLVREAMEKAFEMRAPLTVDISTGPNWAEMEESA
ncbi:MAG: DNA polymerase I [Planctomycetes bacterium]|nr:DNA polymerase I [Planctomycetota bacterium]